MVLKPRARLGTQSADSVARAELPAIFNTSEHRLVGLGTQTTQDLGEAQSRVAKQKQTQERLWAQSETLSQDATAGHVFFRGERSFRHHSLQQTEAPVLADSKKEFGKCGGRVPDAV